MNIKKAILIAVLIGGGLYVIVDYFYASDQEKIENLVLKAEKAVEEGNCKVLKDIISFDYYFDELNYKAFVDRVETTLKKYSPMRIIILNQQVDISSKESAILQLTAIATGEQNSQLPGTTRSSWKIHLKKEYSDWKAIGVELLKE